MQDNACCADDYRRFVHQLSGRVRSRYHPEYAGWLRQSAGSQPVVQRLPEMIVRAETVEDVMATVRFAAQYHHPLSIKMGECRYGHDFVRGNGIFLDISALRDCVLDADNALAMVGPGLSCRELNHRLEKQGLTFPIGDEEHATIGGFLLAGGIGSHLPSRERMGGLNIVAVDLVTADGQLHRVSESEHSPLFWAAQGAGTNAFCVMVRFYLKCCS
ncbi:FAD-dependent oxidoreductase [Serratia nevei]|uniref:FAD-binding oxidoreductase n=1 Tax=Serratia nevei TaxID=2703794 RepID=UPI0020A21015|nr:FAD-dependent oxidoreductase [Serratia nevei]MCP1107561.1 FAD-dependent oxidoreductase [Serratia nevei]